MNPAASIHNIPTVEFVIIPKEDLYLLGPKKINSLKRVDKDTPYPCVMQKPQSFSSMFRHYAKHNGLDKSSLRFFFVEELKFDQTPESVAMMPHDIIYVSHVVTPEPKLTEPHNCQLAKCLGELLTVDANNLSDITFRVGPEAEPIKAHKALLCSRSPYFAAMFRPSGLSESSAAEVRLPTCKSSAFHKILEFVYTSDVKGLKDYKMEDIFDIICVASEYLLDDLQDLCEKTLMAAIDTSTVCSCFVFATKTLCSPVLQEFCQDYIVANISKLRVDEDFRSVVTGNPALALLLVDYVSGSHKKRKRNSSGEDDIGITGSQNISVDGSFDE